jgi:hypothetical protein
VSAAVAEDGKVPEAPPVTLVLTSSNRLDMLERTLASFFRHNDYPLARAIVIEDSDNRDFLAVIERFRDYGVEGMFNGQRLGQHRSIDRAYATVETEYVFHCENDYDFGRPGIIRESVAILEAEPDILMVLPRAKEELPYYLDSVPVRHVGGAAYRKVGPRLHDKWYTFSFNPGLRRMSDYRLLPHGYTPFAREEEISKYYKTLGKAMAILVDGQAHHFGARRSTTVLRRRFDPMHRLEKGARSLSRRTAHYLRRLGIGDGSE